MDILVELPGWFGDPDAVAGYAASADRGPAWLARDESGPAGILVARRHCPESAEIERMAVRPRARGHGVGRTLIAAFEDWAVHEGVRALLVKTLGPSHPDPDYVETRAFYTAVGFIALEESRKIWGPDNSCLLAVKPVGAGGPERPPQ